MEKFIKKRQELKAKGDKSSLPKGVFEEASGLLGSAYKRLAELNFRAKSIGKGAKKVKEMLEKSRVGYLIGYDYNLSAHWNGVQYLSIESALTGKISEPQYWHAAMLASKTDLRIKPPGKSHIWAEGSIAELYLLAPLVGQDKQLDKAKRTLEELIKLTKKYWDKENDFPIKSTQRQFNRYIYWWTKENGYFPAAETDLASDAKELIKYMEEKVVEFL